MESSPVLELTNEQLDDGSYVDRIANNWEGHSGGVATVRSELQTSQKPKMRRAIDTMLDSSGVHYAGNESIVLSGLDTIHIAQETALALKERKIKPTILLKLSSMPETLHTVMCKVFGDADFSTFQPENIPGVRDGYRSLLGRVKNNGKGNFVGVNSANPEVRDVEMPAWELYRRALGSFSTPLVKELVDDGVILSEDVWAFPTQVDVDRMNEGIGKNHWTLDSFTDVWLRSMTVPHGELERAALDMPQVHSVAEASKTGRKVRYTREDGTDITFSLKGRAVCLDSGRVGNNSLLGTTPFPDTLTNQPTGEIFFTVIENSANGFFSYNVSQRVPLGVVNAPYSIYFKDGKVTHVEVKDKVSKRILEDMTGINPYYDTHMSPAQKMAFGMRRIIAEVAFGGINPVVRPLVEAGLIGPHTGSLIFDEKTANHECPGANDFIGGKTPYVIDGETVGHYDNISNVIGGEIELL